MKSFKWASLAVGFCLSLPALAAPKLIYIDPGHTLEFPGVIGACGTHEVFVNDAISLKLARLLQGTGYRVQFSRLPNLDRSRISPQNGREPAEGLRARGARANQLKADLFISIHHDSVSENDLVADPNACAGFERAQTEPPMVISQEFLSQPDVQVGFNVFMMRDANRVQRTENSLRLANLIGQEFVRMGETPSTYHVPEHDEGCSSCRIENRELGVVSRTLGVLRETNMPAVLVEVTNLRIESMERNANSETYQQAVAEGLFQAVQKYFQQP